MSDYGRLSIWKSDPALDSWYNAAVEANVGFCDTGKSEMEGLLVFDISKSNQIKYPNSGANDWFYDATKAENTRIGANACQIAATLSTSSGYGLALPVFESRRPTSDKPLPPVPDASTSFAPEGNGTPYFDYIFANASLESQAELGRHSPDNVSFEINDEAIEQETLNDNDGNQVEDAASPEEYMPRTPEYSQDNVTFDNLDDAVFATRSFLQRGTSITDKYCAKTCFATANDSGHFFFNLANEAELDAVSFGFFSGFAVESSSPHHAPFIDHSPGFGDTHGGTEAFPRQWQDKERRARQYKLKEAGTVFENHPIDTTGDSSRPVLMPKPWKLASTESLYSRRKSPAIIELTSHDGSRHGSNDTGKKRKADDLFTTESFLDTCSSDDYEDQYLYTKKARVISESKNDAEVEMDHDPPTHSLTTIPDADQEHMSTISETASAIFAKIAPAPIGYPGRFCGAMKLKQVVRDKPVCRSSSSNNKTTTMGDSLHPNYLFAHTNFHPCQHKDKLDYRMRTARPGTPLFRSIEYADKLADQAADTPRTAAEEALRREIHSESALARLEGVCVGEYRYYQGHLNIEEYKEAGMCVCWEACQCAKMCTRFPDMLCPCSSYIQIHK